MSLARQIMLDNPTGYWPLDESSGTTAKDRSGNGHDGTYTGSFALAARQVRPGVLAADLTGGYVNIGDVAAFESEAGGSGLLTIEGWFLADTVNASAPMLFTKGKSADYEWTFLIATASGGLVEFGVYQTSGANVLQIDASPFTFVARLHHFMCTFDRAAPLAVIYLDGVNVGQTTSMSGNATGGTSQVRIGSRESDGTNFDGGICDVAIYNVALSAARAKAHYEAGIRDGVSV